MRRWLGFLILLPMTLGFRVLPGVNGWAISKDDPTIWVRSCTKPGFTANDLPAGDVLTGGAPPSYDAALASILNDYNNIAGSYLRLAPYPADPSNPGTPNPGDSTFTLAAAAERTIDVCFESQTITAGHALPKYSDEGRITGCTIKLNTNEIETAKNFVSVLTHELGHCVGLDHAQETEHAAMSYFSSAVRLELDDRMGVVFLYPQESAFGNEHASFGLACSPR